MKVFYLAHNLSVKSFELLNSFGEFKILYEGGDIPAEVSINNSFFQMNSELSASEMNYLLKNNPVNREIIMQEAMNDFRNYLLKTRFSRIDFIGNYYAFSCFSNIVDRAIFFFEENKPLELFCSFTPHSIVSWIFISTLEKLGVKIIKLTDSLLPWIMLPVNALDNRAKSISHVNDNIENIKLNNYLSLLRQDYKLAQPFYERRQELSFIDNIKHFLEQLKPKEIIKLFEKAIINNEYQKAASKDICLNNYVVYFLHYQPEMNTVPEAGIFGDQYQAIFKIASSLPDRMQLLVKEHPSTLSKRSDRRWRPKNFYKRILKIPRVKICSPDLTPFHLIDSAQFVASITGVCLTEALARGVPVITFNPPRFGGVFENDMVVDGLNSTCQDINLFLQQTIPRKNAIYMQRIEECFRKLERIGFDGTTSETYMPQSQQHVTINAIRANDLAIKDFISRKLVL